MAIQFSCDLLRRLSCPTLDDHLGMKLPIGWRVMALGQFTDLAFFLLVLRCSCLHMFGHGSIPFSVTFSSPMVSPLRNAALRRSQLNWIAIPKRCVSTWHGSILRGLRDWACKQDQAASHV